MDLANHRCRETLLAWAHHVREFLAKRADEATVASIDQAIQQYRDSRFSLAVLGKAKRGKSTLLNALLGRQDDIVAPVDKLPTSSAISRFTWAAEEKATVHFRDGKSEHIPFTRIREFVTEEYNPENSQGVEIVDICGPFSELDREVEIVDTPGAGSIHEHHDAILHAFIPRADAVIFLVSARMPPDQDELELLSHVKAADIGKLFFAINRADEASAEDLAEAIRHNQALLTDAGFPGVMIHSISAKTAFLGDVTSSGVDRLVAQVRQFISENKGRVLNDRLTCRIRQLAEATRLALAVEVAGSTKSREEISIDLQHLEDSKQSHEAIRSLSEREFLLDWNNAIDQFDRCLTDIRVEATNELLTRVTSTGVTEIVRLAQRLPTMITRTVEERLEPPAHRLESALRDVSLKLQARYPAVSLGGLEIQNVRTDDNGTLVLGSLGGIIGTAAGVGLAAAGSAAAASIAAANAAALAAASTTVAAPSVLSTLLASVPYLGGTLSSLATGTATVATPVALTTTPLWVALAGPVGWTLVGVGALTIPLAWRTSKLKLKGQLEDAVRDQVKQMINGVRNDRLPSLRTMATTIVDEFHLRLDQQLSQMAAAMIKIRDDGSSPDAIEQLRRDHRNLLSLLNEPRKLLEMA